jgi:hypothetical protein
VCGKGFYINADYQAHMGGCHSGEKHKCETCGKEFPEKKRNVEVIGKFMILRANGFHVISVGNVLFLNTNS